MKRILKASFLFAVISLLSQSFSSCSEDDTFIGRSVSIKEEIFRQNLKAKTVGGTRATIVNSKEELVDCIGDAANTDPAFMGINFDKSTFILDSDTIKYVIPTNIPDVRTTYLTRGLSGNYAFSYYIETQKAETDNPEADDINNAKRPYVIGVVVDKLPSGTEVYLDKNLNFIDSTVHGYPTKIGKIKRYK